MPTLDGDSIMEALNGMRKVIIEKVIKEAWDKHVYTLGACDPSCTVWIEGREQFIEEVVNKLTNPKA